MAGATHLTAFEVKGMLKATKNHRDNALLSTGFCTGFRISELLKIRITDVANIINGFVHIKDVINLKTSKNKSSRSVRINSTARKALDKRVKELLAQGKNENCAMFGRKAHSTQAISSQYANRLIKKIALTAHIFKSKISSHSMRKSFSAELYRIFNHDIAKLRLALGHKSVNSTIAYISFLLVDIDDAINQISF